MQNLSTHPRAAARSRSRHLAARFGTELRIARVTSGLSQEQLAGAAGLGQTAVSRVERGIIRRRWKCAAGSPPHVDTRSGGASILWPPFASATRGSSHLRGPSPRLRIPAGRLLLRPPSRPVTRVLRTWSWRVAMRFSTLRSSAHSLMFKLSCDPLS
ncbi:MAG TPA: helix-turn-helix transcriptional regulator [Candidatus Limnocylindria bacterium]